MQFWSSREVTAVLLHLRVRGVIVQGLSLPLVVPRALWDKQHSPYYIFDHMDIAESEKLVIRPGTEICFMGPYKFMIQSGAQLVARGTRESPILFYASDTTRGWQHLFINHRSSHDTLQWCIFRHGNMVDNSDFYHDGGAIYALGRSPPG